MRKTAREIAFDALAACRKKHAWSDGYLKAAIRINGLDARDAALATHICYGVLQNDKLLDYYIGCYCSQKTNHLEPAVLDLLRIGAYQILFFDKVPMSAAVNETVELAKKCGMARAGGMVNAVLRKLGTNKDKLPAIPRGDDDVRYLAIRYSHPAWLIRRLISILGREEAELFLKSNNGMVPTTIQVNTLKTTDEELVKELESAGIIVTKHKLLDGCYTLEKTGNIEQLAAFNEGRFMVQDAAAKLVSRVADVRENMTVIDICAAPGGKSFSAAMAMQNKGKILSFDIHAGKLSLIREGAEKLGISIITAKVGDAKLKNGALEGLADVVIADVPCSGLGIIRKKPDIRRKVEKELEGLPNIQSMILDNAAAYVKAGGVLVYSTCTVLPEENEKVTDSFLRRHKDFVREIFELPQPIGAVPAGQITLWPQRYDTDGFYICKLRKKK